MIPVLLTTSSIYLGTPRRRSYPDARICIGLEVVASHAPDTAVPQHKILAGLEGGGRDEVWEDSQGEERGGMHDDSG